MILLLHLMEQLYLHSSTSKTWETSLWLWRKWGFLLLKPLIWNRWVCSFIDKKMMGFWSCKFASNFGVWSTFTKIKFVNEQTIQNGPNPISLFHFLNFQGGKSARIVNCVLALKSYYNWKQGGGNGSWKYGGTCKPPVSGKQFARRNSEPFVNSFSRSSSISDRSLDGFSNEQFLNSDLGNDPSEMVSLLPYYKERVVRTSTFVFYFYLFFAFWYAEYLSPLQYACPCSAFW